MLKGPTLRAAEIAGTAVFRMVVSRDSMNSATATSQGKSRLLDAESAVAWISFEGGPEGFIQFEYWNRSLYKLSCRY